MIFLRLAWFALVTYTALGLALLTVLWPFLCLVLAVYLILN
jgi:hypothetical protein